MHPLQNGTQVEVAPEPKPTSGEPGYFTESGNSGLPSMPGADWFNAAIKEFKNALVANGVVFRPGQFNHLQTMLVNASSGARNLLESNQNFNVNGANGGLTHLNQTFRDGQEFSHGWFVIGGADLVDIKKTDGVITAKSGKIRRGCRKDPAGLLTAESVYGSVTTRDGTQTYSDSMLMSGVEITEDESNVYINIDFSVYTGGIAKVGISETRGSISSISNQESTAHLGRIVDSNSGIQSGYILFENGILEQYARWSKPAGFTSSVTVKLPVSYLNNGFVVWSSAENGVMPLNQYPQSGNSVLLGGNGHWTNAQNVGTGYVFTRGTV